MITKVKAPYNRTLEISQEEKEVLSKSLSYISKGCDYKSLLNKIINQDIFDTIDHLPDNFVDLMIIDPPYNLYKNYNDSVFKSMNEQGYIEYVDSWLSKLIRTLKPNATVYICCDWKSSAAIYNIGCKYLNVKNRITWEREKGKGSKVNWKNCSEDIWFFTKSNEYTFNINSVMVKRRVLAPYTTEKGTPKDWIVEKKGNFRITHPSNFWNDLTVPFWSMPENTPHPTQKPEKLIAKLILASSNEGDFVFDPFGGSGTTAVTAKKLNRNYLIVERELEYCCLAQKRLQLAEEEKTIQGFNGEVFLERNTNIKM